MKMYKISADLLEDEEINSKDQNLKNRIFKTYDHQNNSFDGEKLKELLFPEIESSSIFISHSHDDFKKACYLKEFIEKKYHRQVFIDSFYWASIYEAKKLLEKEYSQSSVVGHLQTMLIVAISKMIEACNLFLFIDSSYSVPKDGTATKSHWIYFELQIAEMFKEKMKPGIVAESVDFKPEMLCFYDVNKILDDMEKIEDLEYLRTII